MKGLMIFHARVREQLEDKSWVSRAAERHDTVRRVEIAKECNCDYSFSRHFGGGYSSEKEHEHPESH